MKLLLIGCGKMGSAMLNGWLKDKQISEVFIIDLNIDHLPKDPRITGLNSPDQLPDDFKPDVIILAVKPQIMDKVISQYSKYDDAIFLSIAAGKNIKYFEDKLGIDKKIIRSMPNTPAAIGEGITVAVGNKNISDADKITVNKLLSSVGQAIIIDDENQIDAVTAISGSGPAYVFLLIEAMTKAGVNAGLPEELSEKLSRQTVIGSGLLAKSDAHLSASEMRENVTSPNGTTYAALQVLMNYDKGIQDIMNKAVQAAKERSIELSN